LVNHTIYFTFQFVVIQLDITSLSLFLLELTDAVYSISTFIYSFAIEFFV